MPTIKSAVEKANVLGGEASDIRAVPPPLPRGVESYGYLRWLVGTYYDLQKHRIQAGNRLKNLSKVIGIPADQIGNITEWMHLHLERMEVELKSTVLVQIKRHPLWDTWLKEVRGVGPCIAGSIIAHIGGEHYTALSEVEARIQKARGLEVVWREIEVKSREIGEEDTSVKGFFLVKHGPAAFDTVSKFWTYCGVGLDKNGLPQRRRAGQRSNWKPAMKVIAWKASESFVRCGDGYRELYDQKKAKLQAEPPHEMSISEPPERLFGKLLTEKVSGFPPDTILTKIKLSKIQRDGVKSLVLRLRPGHIEARARRSVAKVFLAHTLMVWRSLVGLKTDPVWAIAKGGHKTEIPIVMR